MDKKEARKILGVSKEISKNDIERKYSILLKKHRMEMARQEEESDGYSDDGRNENTGRNAVLTEEKQEYSFEQITQAYNVLMDYEVVVKEEPPSKAAPLLKKAGIDEKKARNFFYYYKLHMLGAIIAIIAIVLTVRGCVTRVEPDFMTAFLGRISYSDTEKLKEAIKVNVPEIKEPGFDGAFISDENPGDQQYAMTMKATVLMAAGEIDIFITDKANYERYAKEGAFENLDEIAQQLGVDMEKNKDNILKVEPASGSGDEDKTGGTGEGTETEGTTEAHLYGIDISNSSVLKDSEVYGNDMIASIYINSKHKDNAVKLLKFLMK